MVELLLSMPKVLGSIPSTKRKTETEEGGGERKGREKRGELQRGGCKDYLPATCHLPGKGAYRMLSLARFQSSILDQQCRLIAIGGAENV